MCCLPLPSHAAPSSSSNRITFNYYKGRSQIAIPVSISQLSTGPWRGRHPCYYLRGHCTGSGYTRVAAGSEKIHRLLDRDPNSDLILRTSYLIPRTSYFPQEWRLDLIPTASTSIFTAIIFDIRSRLKASVLARKRPLCPHYRRHLFGTHAVLSKDPPLSQVPVMLHRRRQACGSLC
jgi:hypothetical protein